MITWNDVQDNLDNCNSVIAEYKSISKNPEISLNDKFEMLNKVYDKLMMICDMINDIEE